jgi:PAS domain S-box-containing protein
MRNRVGVASGTLEVRTAPGAGTTVTARVPTAAWALDAWHPDGGPRDMRSAVDAILHGVSDPFIALDTEWRFVYLNHAAAQYFGRPADELLGRGMWDVFPEGVGRAFHTAYHRAMAEQRSLQVEEYYEPWDRWYENRIVPSPRGVTIFFSDVTDRHRLRQDRSVTEFGVAVTEAWSTALVGHGDPGTAVLAAARACLADGLARGVRVRAGDLEVEVGETDGGESADLVVGDQVLGTFAVAWTRPADDTTARLTRRTAQMVSMRLAQAGMRSNGEE